MWEIFTGFYNGHKFDVADLCLYLIKYQGQGEISYNISDLGKVSTWGWNFNGDRETLVKNIKTYSSPWLMTPHHNVAFIAQCMNLKKDLTEIYDSIHCRIFRDPLLNKILLESKVPRETRVKICSRDCKVAYKEIMDFANDYAHHCKEKVIPDSHHVEYSFVKREGKEIFTGLSGDLIDYLTTMIRDTPDVPIDKKKLHLYFGCTRAPKTLTMQQFFKIVKLCEDHKKLYCPTYMNKVLRKYSHDVETFINVRRFKIVKIFEKCFNVKLKKYEGYLSIIGGELIMSTKKIDYKP
jgi:hypothetical protein